MLKVVRDLLKLSCTVSLQLVRFVPAVKLEYVFLKYKTWTHKTWMHLHRFELDARVKVEIQNYLEIRRKMKNTVASS